MVSKLQNVSRTRWFIVAAIVVVSCFIPQMVQAASEAGGAYSPPLYGTFWSLVPPVVAIVLALVTKEVFSSLFLGIVVGAVFWASGANPGVYDDAGEAVWESTNVFTGTLNHLVRDGFLAQLTDPWNMGIIIFLIVLGMLVAMMSKVGGSRAFGEWAARKIKTRRGAQGALMIFHLFIFIDDYFSCLTVGNVMRPVTDKARVSRAKLAYLIDATAAPVCILAPISTWAAAVASYVPDEGPGSEVDGFQMFISAIPFNFYAILSIIMIITLIVTRFDYGPMAKFEYNAEMNEDLYTTPGRPYDSAETETSNEKGTVIDLAMPIIILIICCVFGLVYTGGFFSPGEDSYLNFASAFSNADAATGLVIGSLCAIVLIILYYVAKKLIKLRELTDILPKGINAMASPCLILTFAWTLKAMTDTMGSREFVSAAMENSAPGFQAFLPAIIFLVACFIAFSTGTSWGTFGILVPIVCSVLSGPGSDPQLLIISTAACLAGGVFGDHCSPISDTTIMASAGAQCDHIDHVNTQLPYAATVAAWSLVMYIISGFVRNAFIVLPIAIIGFLAILMIIRKTKGQIIDHDLIEKQKTA